MGGNVGGGEDGVEEVGEGVGGGIRGWERGRERVGKGRMGLVERIRGCGKSGEGWRVLEREERWWKVGEGGEGWRVEWEREERGEGCGKGRRVRRGVEMQDE